jgi:hypothetical protein
MERYVERKRNRERETERERDMSDRQAMTVRAVK